MCNTTVRLPDHAVSAPFKRLDSKNYLKQKQQPIKSEPSCGRPVPIASAPAAVSQGNIPKKPMRPLTAYHIFFQIEREYIIQTTAGENADKTILDGKKCIDDVPDKYRDIKLSPDWYFGPGKRAKRKHRKQHGKIGFLELSRVISTRWAQLDETDPDIKAYVSKLAKQELEEYQREVEEYKELTKGMVPAQPPVKTTSKKNKKRKLAEQQQQQEIARMQQQQQECMMQMMPQHQQMAMAAQHPTPAMLATFQRTFYGSGPSNQHSFDDKPAFMNNSAQLRQEIDQLKNEIEYVNSCIDKYTHHFQQGNNPMPTFTNQTTSSAPSKKQPPKKQFYRRQSSNISLSFLDSVMDDLAKHEPSPKKAKKGQPKKDFYHRQSSGISLSFLDSLADKINEEVVETKKGKEGPTKKNFYRKMSSGMSLSFLDSLADKIKEEPVATKKGKASSTKKNFYRRQSSTLSLSFLDSIVDKMPKEETSDKKQRTDNTSSPVNVVDVKDDDIMSLWVQQNSL